MEDDLTDSFEIYVDNCASRTLTNDLHDFINSPTPTDITILGTNEKSMGTLMGTIKWSIEDDEGMVHDVMIPNSLYSSDNRSKPLSPQHWAQEANDRHPIRNGTWCATYDDRIMLFWDQQKYKKTVHLIHNCSNVGVIRSVPRIETYMKTCKTIEKDLKELIVAMPFILETEQYDHDTDNGQPHVVTDSEEEPEGNQLITYRMQGQQPLQYP
jgi:hypothetical protein